MESSIAYRSIMIHFDRFNKSGNVQCFMIVPSLTQQIQYNNFIYSPIITYLRPKPNEDNAIVYLFSVFLFLTFNVGMENIIYFQINQFRCNSFLIGVHDYTQIKSLAALLPLFLLLLQSICSFLFVLFCNFFL